MYITQFSQKSQMDPVSSQPTILHYIFRLENSISSRAGGDAGIVKGEVPARRPGQGQHSSTKPSTKSDKNDDGKSE